MTTLEKVERELKFRERHRSIQCTLSDDDLRTIAEALRINCAPMNDDAFGVARLAESLGAKRNV